MPEKIDTDLYDTLAPQSINHAQIMLSDLLALRPQSAVHSQQPIRHHDQ